MMSDEHKETDLERVARLLDKNNEQLRTENEKLRGLVDMYQGLERSFIEKCQYYEQELAKYKPVRIDPDDESTWPPRMKWHMVYNGHGWAIDLISLWTDISKKKITHWLPEPPKPGDE